MIQFTIKYNVSYENLHFCVCDFFVVRFIELLLERRKWNIIAQFCDGISHCHRRILYCSYKRDIVICVCSSVSLVNTTETMQSLVFEQSTADLIGVLLFLCIQIDIVCFFFFFSFRYSSNTELIITRSLLFLLSIYVFLHLYTFFSPQPLRETTDDWTSFIFLLSSFALIL